MEPGRGAGTRCYSVRASAHQPRRACPCRPFNDRHQASPLLQPVTASSPLSWTDLIVLRLCARCVECGTPRLTRTGNSCLHGGRRVVTSQHSGVRSANHLCSISVVGLGRVGSATMSHMLGSGRARAWLQEDAMTDTVVWRLARFGCRVGRLRSSCRVPVTHPLCRPRP